MRLSDAAAKVPIPIGKMDAIIFDDDVPGFGVRLRKSNADGPILRTWVFQYRSPKNGETKRITFGSPGTLKAVRARAHAGQLHAQVKLGKDPQDDKRSARDRAKETFEKRVAEYLKRREAEVAAGKLAQAT
jgi:hypothetical protein